MPRSPLVAALALAAVSALSTPAQADYRAINGMWVRDLGKGEFLVVFMARPNETDYWCAAGDFAQRILGANGKTRLYRVTPPPRKPGQGIVFTLDPAKSGGRTGVSSFGAGAEKDSLSVGHVTGNFCQLPPLLWVY